MTFENTLTAFGKKTLEERYVLDGESIDQLFVRVSKAYANDDAHANRLLEYMSKLWFMPATPVLSNAGTNRGLPISCNLNEVQDSMESIENIICSENFNLSKNAAGLATNYSNLRPLGAKIKNKGTSGGIVPLIKIQESISMAINQGGIRRGSSACYLHIRHPEIKEFINIRRPIGDLKRKALEMHHGVVVSDEFMNLILKEKKEDRMWSLIDPKTNEVKETIDARELWIELTTTRIETGEPYIIFEDNANNQKYGCPEIWNILNLKLKTSNLCSEIFVPTGIDHLGNERTGICCLSSLNLETYKEWEGNEQFLKDVLYFLDNILTDYIKKAPPQLSAAVYSAIQSRTIGLGVMGFHSFLQSQNVAFEGVMARSWNKRIFKYIKETCDKFNQEIAEERGEALDVTYAREQGLYNGKKMRFITMFAIAPTASISNICGESSPGIEPYAANVFTQKTLSGSFVVKNKHLRKLLELKKQDTQEIWSSIATNDGSVQHLDFLTSEEKSVFKTSFEINQAWIIEHASDRQPFICQGQSVNLFLKGNISKATLHQLHYGAWKKGLKSLYYCRSTSIQRADKVSNMINNGTKEIEIKKEIGGEECLSCQ